MERKVRGHDGWTKDPSNGVVKCTNRSEYDKYMKGYWAEKKKEEERKRQEQLRIEKEQRKLHEEQLELERKMESRMRR